MKPDVVDTAEIARRFGVDTGTVHQWRQRYPRYVRLPQFPAPDFNLDMGPAWLWKKVQTWGEQTGRLEK